MAIGAGSRRISVAAAQWEADCAVIELGVQPIVGPVAVFAGRRKSESDVIG